jgi:hypothetical protein
MKDWNDFVSYMQALVAPVLSKRGNVDKEQAKKIIGIEMNKGLLEANEKLEKSILNDLEDKNSQLEYIENQISFYQREIDLYKSNSELLKDTDVEGKIYELQGRLNSHVSYKKYLLFEKDNLNKRLTLVEKVKKELKEKN